MNLLKILLLVILTVVLIVYSLLPSLSFPTPPPDSTQSMEDADTETPLRRAYFTNYDRESIIKHYQDQFKVYVFGMALPSMRLNYPPEDAQTIIRDQTRSTFLEELVYPLRESLYINGFKPREAKDEIWYKGVHYEQKITVRFVPSNMIVRLVVVSGILVSIVLIIKFLRQSLVDVITTIKNSHH